MHRYNVSSALIYARMDIKDDFKPEKFMSLDRVPALEPQLIDPNSQSDEPTAEGIVDLSAVAKENVIVLYLAQSFLCDYSYFKDVAEELKGYYGDMIRAGANVRDIYLPELIDQWGDSNPHFTARGPMYALRHEMFLLCDALEWARSVLSDEHVAVLENVEAHLSNEIAEEELSRHGY